MLKIKSAAIALVALMLVFPAGSANYAAPAGGFSAYYGQAGPTAELSSEPT